MLCWSTTVSSRVPPLQPQSPSFLSCPRQYLSCRATDDFNPIIPSRKHTWYGAWGEHARRYFSHLRPLWESEAQASVSRTSFSGSGSSPAAQDSGRLWWKRRAGRGLGTWGTGGLSLGIAQAVVLGQVHAGRNRTRRRTSRPTKELGSYAPTPPPPTPRFCLMNERTHGHVFHRPNTRGCLTQALPRAHPPPVSGADDHASHGGRRRDGLV